MDTSHPSTVVSADGINHYQAEPIAQAAPQTQTHALTMLPLALFGLVAGINLILISADSLIASTVTTPTYSVVEQPKSLTTPTLRVTADGQGFQQPGSAGLSNLQAGNKVQFR